MNPSRKEAISFDLSARASEDEDVLQVSPEDLSVGAPAGQKKKPEPKPPVADPDLEAKLFNALVAPVAPVRLNESFASGHEPTPASPETNAQPSPVENVLPEVHDPADVNSASEPILAIHPSASDLTPTVHDWEPLPPPMRIVRDTDTPSHETIIPAQGTVVEEAMPIPAPSEPIPRVWDPAAVEAETSPIQENTVLPSDKNHPEPVQPDPILEKPFDTCLEQSVDPTAQLVSHSFDAKPVLTANASSRTGAWWTLPMMCLGLGIIACALIVPAVDENRRELHQLARLERDVSYFQMQSDVNKQFLEHVSTDPALAERLAQRQLRMTRPDSRIVQIPQAGNHPFGMSPYALVTLDPPPPIPDYQPLGGMLSRYFLDSKNQVYLTGIGILMTAAGVILGGGQSKPDQAA